MVWRNRILTAVAALLLLVLTGWGIWRYQKRQAENHLMETLGAQSYQAPGQMIDIGGRKLHLNCTGRGSPTVILIAGGGAFSIDWALVQPEIAKNVRTCSYDRAGLAWSDPSAADETVEQTITDLHALLPAAGETGPYVLVGASIAGIYIRAYQHAFPNEVAALVFTNSSGRVGMRVKGKSDLIWNLTEDEIRSAYPLPVSAKGSLPTREGDPFNRLPSDLQAIRLWLDFRLWRSWNPAKTGPESMLSWRKEFVREFDEGKPGHPRPLGALPVMVVSSSPAANESICHSRDIASACLDYLSINTAHLVAKGSGHEIHLYQPDTVVRALLQLRSALEHRTALANSSLP